MSVTNFWPVTVGADSMGAIAPSPPRPRIKLWGRCPKVAPQEFCDVAVVYISKRYSKNYDCVIMKVKKVR